MKEAVIIINEDFLGRVQALLEENNISYRIAGFPNGEVEVIEKFQSKINVHVDMRRYAKSLGYESVTDAIGAVGSATVFKQNFNKFLKENG